MNRLAIGFLCLLLAASVCFGQAAATPAPAAAVVGHGAFPVKTTKTLDSSKLKQDDSIEVETSGSFKLPDGTLVPKGSKLEGRVVSSKARSKGDPESELTLAFDKLNIQGGKQLALKGAVQAVYPPADEPQGPNMSTAGTSQGGSVGGVGSRGSFRRCEPRWYWDHQCKKWIEHADLFRTTGDRYEGDGCAGAR